MGRIITCANRKGGAGKTTLVGNLGYALAQRGKKVCLIDFDPQYNLSAAFGVDAEEYDLDTSYEIIFPANKGKGYKYALYPMQERFGTPARIDLIPASLRLDGAEIGLASRPLPQILLSNELRGIRDEYDYVLIDTNPSLGILTQNALVAADSIYVPVQAHIHAYNAIAQLEQTIEAMRPLNQRLAIGGIIVTFFQKRTRLSNIILDKARKQYPDELFNTLINYNIDIAEAPISKTPITIYSPDSPGARDYAALAAEVEARDGKPQR